MELMDAIRVRGAEVQRFQVFPLPDGVTWAACSSFLGLIYLRFQYVERVTLDQAVGVETHRSVSREVRQGELRLLARSTG